MLASVEINIQLFVSLSRFLHTYIYAYTYAVTITYVSWSRDLKLSRGGGAQTNFSETRIDVGRPILSGWRGPKGVQNEFVLACDGTS